MYLLLLFKWKLLSIALLGLCLKPGCAGLETDCFTTMQMDEGNDDIEALNYDDLEAVARLQSSDKYKTIMQVWLCFQMYHQETCKHYSRPF